MTIRLKECTKNSWIVTDGEKNVGILNKKVDDSYIALFNSQRNVFKNKDAVIDFFNQDIFKASTNIRNEKTSKTIYVKGYPVSVNEVSDVIEDHQSVLPLFRKSNKSKVTFAAGYYCIQYNSWLGSFCPKLSTLQNHKYIGPFTDEINMKTELARLNNEKKRIIKDENS